jgi:multiple sugar transport system ATP-binding protein
MAEVVLNQVTKKFGPVTAVRDLSLTIADSEFVVLLGPTGAGKTTTLRLVSGLERADAGSISIAGIDVTKLEPAARDVAMVFQQFSLYPHYTVFDNLAFPLRSPLRRLPEPQVEERVRAVASLLRIEPKLKNKATHLSGGEMQRVAIGRALVREPAVFLMDEPLSSLDAKLRAGLRIEMKRIQLDLGATILYVTHDQVEAMTMADRIGVLREGALVQIGTPRQIYAEPDSLYVANRLGSPQINELPVGSLGIMDGPAGAATIGVRPEDVVLGAGGVAGRILTVEPLGAETVILLEVAGSRVHALAGPGPMLCPQDSTTVRVIPGTTLFFDREGRRLPWAARSERPDRGELRHGT